MQRPPGYWPLIIGEVAAILIVSGAVQHSSGAAVGLVVLAVLALVARVGNRKWWQHQREKDQ
jgi:hypothetical protein